LFWCLAVVAGFFAGTYSVRSTVQMSYWRGLKASRNIRSEAQREAASRGLWLLINWILCTLAAIVLGLLATFGGDR
jgi:hypothetical protein